MTPSKSTALLAALLALLLLCLGPNAAFGQVGAGEEGTGQGNGAEAAADAANDAADAADAAASEAAEAAANAAKAAEASSEAAGAAQQAADAAGGAGSSQSATLSEPGQGVTASQGQAPGAGVSAMDRAALDAVTVNPDAWSPL